MGSHESLVAVWQKSDGSLSKVWLRTLSSLFGTIFSLKPFFKTLILSWPKRAKRVRYQTCITPVPKFFVYTDYHQKKEFIHYIIMHPQHHRPPSTTQKNLKLSPSNHSTPYYTFTHKISASPSNSFPITHTSIHRHQRSVRTRAARIWMKFPRYTSTTFSPHVYLHTARIALCTGSLSLSLSPMVNGSAQQVEGRRRGVFLKRKKEREREKGKPPLSRTPGRYFLPACA